MLSKTIRRASWTRSDEIFSSWYAERDKFIGHCVRNAEFFPQKLQSLARETPDAIAIKTEKSILTFSDLDAAANQRARFYSEIGVKSGDHLGLFAENSASYLISMYAANKINAVPALINKSLRGDALKYAIESADCTLLHIDDTDDQNSAISEIDLTANKIVIVSEHESPENGVLTVEHDSLDASQHDLSKLSVKDRMALIYTSGTTGYPKPAIYTHGANLWAGGLGIMMKWGPEDTLFTGCPLFHTLGSMMGASGILWRGGSFACQTNFSASTFMKDAIKFDATTISYVGEMLRYISLTKPDPKIDQKHKIRNGFGPGLRPDVWKNWLQRFGKIHFGELYGSSEGIVGLYNLDPDDVGMICRFTPMVQDRLQSRLFKYDPETELPIRCHQGLGIPAGVNEPGILLSKLSETRRFNGYYNAQNKTNDKIIENLLGPNEKWFNTGDALIYDEEYRLRFMDRLGDTYRWRGENTSTEEVTNLITVLDFVADCAVYGVEVPGNEGKAGMAAIVTKSGYLTSTDLSDLYSKLTMNLQKHSRPIFIRLVENIPKTANYKNKKIELVSDGYNVENVWVLQGEKYVSLTKELGDKLTQTTS